MDSEVPIPSKQQNYLFRYYQNGVAARFEARVKELVDNLKSNSLETVREANSELRILAKDLDNQIIIASCGAIGPLVNLLRSSDMNTQENAVIAVLNLSINNNNKNKIRVGNSGAIDALMEFLGNGTPHGRKDAATALFYLSTHSDNWLTIVRLGAIKHRIDLMDPATGMTDKAVVVLENLASSPKGRKAIAEAGGISLLVEAIELGSPRGENAAAALVHFCADSYKYCRRVLDEGAMPPLVILSMSGTSRAKEKELSTRHTLSLAFQTLGVVYGDVDTSPLYVFTDVFSKVPITSEVDILVALSVTMYTIALVPLAKYVFVVLKANDNGEGT
uniref:Uncharacterized protein n=1 Tax=Chenopodium quinoa TaxID=63459 RepID=A0A803N0B1_CHEQI